MEKEVVVCIGMFVLLYTGQKHQENCWLTVSQQTAKKDSPQSVNIQLTTGQQATNSISWKLFSWKLFYQQT